MATQILVTVKPSGGDYTSLASALSDNQQNLVSGDKYLDIEISGTWSSADSPATYDGYTADVSSDNYVYIYTTGDARHEGKWSDSKYRIEVTSANARAINAFRSDYFVDGIQVEFPGGTSTDWRVIGTSGFMPSNHSYGWYNCIFYQNSSSTAIAHLMVNANSQTAYLYNCIVDSLKGSSSSFTSTIRNQGTALNVYNCTFYDNTRVYYSDTVTAKNTGQAGSDNSSSASSETTCSASTPTFIDESAQGDFHLNSSDTTWKDQGTDLSGESFPVIGSLTTDIDGDTRSTWDIGADEVVGGGATPTTLPPQIIIWGSKFGSKEIRKNYFTPIVLILILAGLLFFGSFFQKDTSLGDAESQVETTTDKILPVESQEIEQQEDTDNIPPIMTF